MSLKIELLKKYRKNLNIPFFNKRQLYLLNGPRRVGEGHVHVMNNFILDNRIHIYFKIDELKERIAAGRGDGDYSDDLKKGIRAGRIHHQELLRGRQQAFRDLKAFDDVEDIALKYAADEGWGRLGSESDRLARKIRLWFKNNTEMFTAPIQRKPWDAGDPMIVETATAWINNLLADYRTLNQLDCEKQLRKEARAVKKMAKEAALTERRTARDNRKKLGVVNSFWKPKGMKINHFGMKF